MPMRPMPICTYPACREKAVKGSRCAKHPYTVPVVAKREGSAALGYGYHWQKIRKAYLDKYPACVVCGNSWGNCQDAGRCYARCPRWSWSPRFRLLPSPEHSRTRDKSDKKSAYCGGVSINGFFIHGLSNPSLGCPCQSEP